MKNLILLFCFTLVFSNISFAQVGINTTTPHPSSALDIADNSKGLLIPRMNQSQRDAIANPATGLLIYQTDATAGFYYFDGTNWVSFAGSGGGWGLNGNSGTNPNSNGIGTADNQGLSIVTNNTEALRVASNGNVGIGTATPSTKLHLYTPPTPVSFFDGFEDATIPPFVLNATLYLSFSMYTNESVAAGFETAVFLEESATFTEVESFPVVAVALSGVAFFCSSAIFSFSFNKACSFFTSSACFARSSADGWLKIVKMEKSY